VRTSVYASPLAVGVSPYSWITASNEPAACSTMQYSGMPARAYVTGLSTRSRSLESGETISTTRNTSAAGNCDRSRSTSTPARKIVTSGAGTLRTPTTTPTSMAVRSPCRRNSTLSRNATSECHARRVAAATTRFPSHNSNRTAST
jgi:hypothetical protein